MLQIIKNEAELESANQQLHCSLPYDHDLSPLRQPLNIGVKTAPNRIVYQAMEGCDGTADGQPGELTIRRYRRFAHGGPGIIWFEATAVLPEGKANPHQMYLTKENQDSFARLVAEIKEICIKENGYEPLVLCQLTHSGRYSKPKGTASPLIAYNNPILEGDHPIDTDRIVTDDYLEQVREALINSAILAEKTGFDGVDIKSCHRYLLCELLSAYQRPGKFGGSYENRTLLLRSSVRGVRQSCSSDFIISSRMNAYDGFPYPYGFGVSPKQDILPDYSEAIRLICDLKAEKADVVNVTMGNPYFNPHVNRPYNNGEKQSPEEPLLGVNRMLTGTAQLQSANRDIPLICSGLTWLGAISANVAAACIKQGWFAMAGYGRMTLAYPDIARDIMMDREIDPKKCCITCSKCTQIMRTPGGTPGCVIKDRDQYLPIYQKQCMNP